MVSTTHHLLQKAGGEYLAAVQRLAQGGLLRVERCHLKHEIADALVCVVDDMVCGPQRLLRDLKSWEMERNEETKQMMRFRISLEMEIILSAHVSNKKRRKAI